jgi:endonuclease/exonuclease/phosphatase family metal-dependent hydrolase
VKLLVLFGLCSLSLLHAEEAPPAQPSFRVVTFNIRYENKIDGPNAWTNRREAAAKLIEEHADLAGLQEAKPSQRGWLGEHLPGFGVIGVGRKANDTDEGVPILYRKDRFEVLSSGTFWLSETPEVPESISWESSLPRICTWAKLKDKKAAAGKDVFWYYNVHLDHRAPLAREKGLELVHARMAARGSDEPVLLTGDCNSALTDTPIKKLLAMDQPALITTYESLGVPAAGTFDSFTGKIAGYAIDFIFTQKEAWKVRSGSILKVTYPAVDGQARAVSDHFQVEATIERVR